MAMNINKIGNDTEADRILNTCFSSPVRSTGFVEVGEDKFVLPALYIDWEEKIRKFEVRNEDVIVLGHPKTGTTWLEEMVWLIVNNLDYKRAEIKAFVRVPLLETPVYFDTSVVPPMWIDCHPWEFIEKHESPRVFKSHLHWSVLPEQIKDGTKKPKIISTLRNPHDTFVSYYHHCRLFEGFKGSFQEMCTVFLEGRKMKNDLPGAIRKVARFLEKSISDEQVEILAKHLHFEAMRKNPALNMKEVVNLYSKKYGMHIADNEFIRSGQVGGYKAEMTPAMIEKFDHWQKENLAGTDLTFE